MNPTQHICFIGGGNMAQALIAGLHHNQHDMSTVSVIEIDQAKRQQLQQQYGVQVSDQLPLVSQSDIVVLAVKPQQLRDLSIFLGSLISHQLIVSIAAGVKASDISKWLGGYAHIVRVMPNTPAQIQAGVSALYALSQVNTAQRQAAEHIMQAVGEVLWLDEEQKMDAVTAISGSGPAYIFYFIEAMQEAALALGLDAEQAKTLSLETFVGASLLAAQSLQDPATLRQQVTSKGGTTEQAIQAMQQAEVKQHIIKAIQAAAARSRELGEILGKD
jgi:pyrroline-5-carboxylate reductase